MVQAALASFWKVLEAAATWLLPAGLVLAAAFLALLLVGLLDRERFRAGLDRLARWPRMGGWALLLAALGTGMLGLDTVRRAVDTRLATRQAARYASVADPDGEQTVQSAPSASYLDETTYSRTLVLPRSVLTQINVENGWEQLLPYLGGSAPPNVQSLREGFVQQKNALVYTRDAVLTTERTVNLDTTTVRTDLNFVDSAGGRGSDYNARFEAEYTFRNPTDAPRTMRFNFPLPAGSGTLSGFRLTVNGQEFRAADLVDGSLWEGEVSAGQAVKVNVTYRHQGARSWSYELGRRREAIRKFDLTIRTDRPAKFQRRTLLPTSQTGGGLRGPRTLRWNLNDVVTAQDVAVVFTESNLRETLTKIGALKPFALLMSTVFLLLCAAARRLKLAPLSLGAALLGLGLGWALGSVLGFYLPVPLAEVLGSVMAWWLATRFLERPFALPLLLLALLPLVFLSGGHASALLVAWGIGALLWLRPVRPPVREALQSI